MRRAKNAWPARCKLSPAAIWQDKKYPDGSGILQRHDRWGVATSPRKARRGLLSQGFRG
jgi:hypothetical protein